MAAWQSDAIFIQEEKVPMARGQCVREDVAEAAWKLHVGETTQMMAGTNTPTGVVIHMVHGDPAVMWEPPLTPDARIQKDTGRWVEKATPVGNGTDLASVGKIYGIRGAGQCPKL